jgi:hypothetical protein
MHDQRVAGRELGEQILPATGQRPNGLAPEASLEAGWKWLTEIAAVEHDTVEARAGHGGSQTPQHAFDFRKLGHGDICSARCAARRRLRRSYSSTRGRQTM